MNIYKEILQQNLNKLLNLYDLDPVSPTCGNGDRLYWGWKVSDFPNATMQGGVHSLAIAFELGLLSNKKRLLETVDQIITAIPLCTTSKGSVQEAYPNEHSFCVTALVAFDVLSAIKHLQNTLSTQQISKYLEIISPLIDFITKNDEKHAIISNHVATGVAAITLWNKIAKENNKRHEALLNIIYSNQSKEGWFREYEGADPGYQTLCTYYLASALEDTGDKELKERLILSGSFLKYFAHPDGTVGGLYGSRNTQVYYPGGIIALTGLSEDFQYLATSLHDGTVKGNNLLPQNIDAGNYIPLLNSYAFAAYHLEKNSGLLDKETDKSFMDTAIEKDFQDAGIFIKSNKTYHCIINYKKGGTIKVFDKQKNQLDIEDGGLYGKLNNGTAFSSQHFSHAQKFTEKEIRAGFFKINNALPNPFISIVLRALSLTVFHSVFLGNIFKKAVVKKLMTGKRKIRGSVHRAFQFTDEKIIIKETIEKPSGCLFIKHAGAFKAIHMASSGYFLPQHAEVEKSEIVEFR